jgi:hypothetical protein
MAEPRAVRIPRTAGESTAREVRPAVAPETLGNAGPGLRVNRAGRQRAIRLTAIYLVALLAMYVGFVALDRGTPGGGSEAVTSGLFLFSGIAALLALGGACITLSPAPRSVEVTPAEVVVVEWTGRRRTFPPLSELRVDVIRRYPAGLLSSDPVETVELTGGRRRRTYQLTEGLLPERRPGPG